MIIQQYFPFPVGKLQAATFLGTFWYGRHILANEAKGKQDHERTLYLKKQQERLEMKD